MTLLRIDQGLRSDESEMLEMFELLTGYRGHGQAQAGSLPSQRLNDGCSPLAKESRASVHRSFQITGSCNSLSGLLRLRATKPGKLVLPVDCPIGL